MAHPKETGRDGDVRFGHIRTPTMSSAVRPLFTAHHENATYAKVTWRLVPFLFVCYVCSYLDRVNVGFAKLEMQSDLQLSDAVYGLGAGIFFIGYFLFEIPSNLLLHRFGARRWIARIMITWALLSAATALVNSSASFYVLRFLLGVAEAGFFPGIVLYLTYWYPAKRRARIMALFMTAIPASAVIGGPISGWILQSMSGMGGWAGWRWLFVLESLPSLLIGVMVLFFLEDSIGEARWLSDGEKLLLERNIESEGEQKEALSIRAVFRDRKVWLLSVVYFCIAMGIYGLSFWLPTLIQASGVQNVLEVGILSAIPFGAGTISMIVFARSADRLRERRWHLVAALLIGALGMFLVAGHGGSMIPAMFSLTLAGIGVMAMAPIFWSMPTAFLGGVAAATGIALINSIANLAGFVSPYMVGWIQERTQSTDGGLYAISGFLAAGALLVIMFVPARLVNK